MEITDIDSCDVLVIGGGGAGLRAAIASREAGADVILVAKSRVDFNSNTVIAAGSFAVPSGWFDSEDNPEIHTADTIAGGRFVNDQKLVASISSEIGKQVPFLEQCGVKLVKREPSPGVKTSAPPGHSRTRHISSQNGTGKDFIVPMRKYAQKIGVRLAEKVQITRLFTSRGRFAAATGISEDNRILFFRAGALVLATGGFGQAYLNNDNAASATGDGLVLAWQLGVPVRDMEFVQFYPTAAGKRGNRLVLYEGLVGRGAQFKNSDGDDILAKQGLTDRASLTRDRITRALMSEIISGKGVDGGIVLDLSEFPGPIPRSLLSASETSAEKREFVLTPTTHFCMGGIVIDETMETEVPGVFGAGEICGGVHGANRLAGNSLSEIFAAGEVAGRNAAARSLNADQPEYPGDEIATEVARLESLMSEDGLNVRKLGRTLKEVMWQKVGIIRRGKTMEEALSQIEELKASSVRITTENSRDLIRLIEFKNMLLLSEMVCRAALMRNESRGAHFREDNPQEETEWLKNIIIRNREGKMTLETFDVLFDRVPIR